jgi:hypothetical protein
VLEVVVEMAAVTVPVLEVVRMLRHYQLQD